MIFFLFLSFASASENIQNLEKSAERWKMKGYNQGYKIGSIDVSMSVYDEESYDYAPEDVWNQKYKIYEDDFSKLPIETRKKYFESFREGWLEGYGEVWEGKSKKNQAEKLTTSTGTVYVGMSKQALYKLYSKRRRKDYVNARQSGGMGEKHFSKRKNREWVTFFEEEPGRSSDTITFYLEDEKVKWWDK